jgi:UDP-glucose 4-epimerase
MMLFITGSESFIGRALVSRCRTLGIATAGVDMAAAKGSGSQQIDIRDPALANAIPEGGTVIHLAAISRDADCRKDPRMAFDVNVNGTINVLAAAQKRNAAQLIFASSEWVYGDVSGDATQREDQPIDVTAMKSEYALTKLVGEQYLRLVSKLAATTVLRFGIVYGPRKDNWSALESIFNSVRTKPEISVGSLATARRFIHVDDIVAGILAARQRQGFEIFNLSGDRLVSLGDIVKAGGEITGRKPALTETDPARPSIRNPDNTKARTILGWKPSLDLDAGLKTVEAFLSMAG